MKILVLFFTVVFLSCSQTGTSQNGVEDNQKTSYTFTQKDVAVADLASLNKLDDNVKGLIAGFLGWTDSFEAYLYKSFEENGSSVVLISSIRGKTLHLLISEDDEIKEFIELTKDQCDLMDQYEDYELIHCEIISASIKGNEFGLYRNLIDTKDFGDHTENMKDSLIYNYQINNGITLLIKDSVRVEY